MKYTIPYSDKISLPRINEVLEIEIVAEDINYDQTELEGKIIITGEYTVSEDSEVMEFTHEIPISFLIDDPDVNPSVDINNFTYDVISGKGLEVNFELDVMIAEHEEPEKAEVELDDAIDKEEFQENVNSKLNEFLTDRDEDNTAVYDLNEEIEPEEEIVDEKEAIQEEKEQELVVDERENEEHDVEQVEIENINENQEVEQEQKEDDIDVAMSEIDQEEDDGLVEKGREDREDTEEIEVEITEPDEVELEFDNDEDEAQIEMNVEATEDVLEIEDKTDGEVEVMEEIMNEDGRINIRPSSDISSSESYYDSLRESYSTYKVYFLDDGQSIDDFCEEHDVSRALINDEDTEETRKVVIRVDHE